MKSVLVLKTSTDQTMQRLFEELEDDRVDCLIQTSQRGRFARDYPNIDFVDIKREGFYDIEDSVLYPIFQKHYDECYVTFSGVTGHNYGNVMEIIRQCHYKEAFFYNCDGDRVKIPERSALKDTLIKWYIDFIDWSYRVRNR